MRVRPHHDGLQNADLLDGADEFRERVVVEDRARLTRIGNDARGVQLRESRAGHRNEVDDGTSLVRAASPPKNTSRGRSVRSPVPPSSGRRLGRGDEGAEAAAEAALSSAHLFPPGSRDAMSDAIAK